MSLTPRDYQIRIRDEGLEILRKHWLLYLAMETRTGKTITTFLILEEFIPRGYAPVLFLTKKKIIPAVEADYKLRSWGFSLLVTNYEQIHNLQGPFSAIVTDEAHCLGAFPKANVRTKRLKELAKGMPIILLSATPAAESYSQFFHQFWISETSPWYQYKTFYKWANAGYVSVKKKYLGSVQVNDYTRADKRRIFREVKPYMITLTQEEAGFKAGVNEQIYMVQMLDRTMAMYRAIVKDQVYETDDWSIAINGGGDLMNKCRQLASGTLIVKDVNGEDTGRYIILDESKVEFIKSAFAGERIAIFYYYRAEREMLLKHFPNVTESPEAFQKGEADTFIGQVRSVREGIRLSTADALIMLTIDFSAVSYQQAKARLQDKDRIGDAPLYWIFAKGMLEPDIYKTVQSKDFTYEIFKRL